MIWCVVFLFPPSPCGVDDCRAPRERTGAERGAARAEGRAKQEASGRRAGRLCPLSVCEPRFFFLHFWADKRLTHGKSCMTKMSSSSSQRHPGHCFSFVLLVYSDLDTRVKDIKKNTLAPLPLWTICRLHFINSCLLFYLPFFTWYLNSVIRFLFC